MEKSNVTELIKTYFKSVCEAYRLGNVESSYNAPIITLFTDIRFSININLYKITQKVKARQK